MRQPDGTYLEGGGVTWADVRNAAWIAWSDPLYIKTRHFLINFIDTNDDAHDNLGLNRESPFMTAWRINYRYLSETVDVLDSYNWAFNGQPYTGSGGVTKTTQNNSGFIEFFEPLIVGPCKPRPGFAHGCWRTTSDIIPRVTDFSVVLSHEPDMSKRLIYVDKNVDRDRPARLEMWPEKAYLYTTHIANSVPVPRSLALTRWEHHKLGEVTVDGALQESSAFSHRLQFRGQPRYFMFYFKRQFKDVTNQVNWTLDTTLGWFDMKLDIACESRNIVADRFQLDLMTTQAADYIPPLDHNRSVLLVAYNDLPFTHRDEFTEMGVTGKVFTADYSVFANNRPAHHFEYAFECGLPSATFDIYCTCIYSNEILDLFKNYARVQSEL